MCHGDNGLHLGYHVRVYVCVCFVRVRVINVCVFT